MNPLTGFEVVCQILQTLVLGYWEALLLALVEQTTYRRYHSDY